MTKRTSGKFERRERDFYPTPPRGVLPLIPHLHPGDVIGEPCVGDGALVHALRWHGFAIGLQSDIAQGKDALTITRGDLGLCTVFVTNPPWARDILHSLIPHLSDLLPTWLLMDADWMHTEQSLPFKSRCVKIVSVGRLKWIPFSQYQGVDNCAWYLFDANNTQQTQFYWRD